MKRNKVLTLDAAITIAIKQFRTRQGASDEQITEALANAVVFEAMSRSERDGATFKTRHDFEMAGVRASYMMEEIRKLVYEQLDLPVN